MSRRPRFLRVLVLDKRATGADLLRRMRASQRLDPIEVLADGSYLSKVFEVRNFKRRGDGLVVRVIDYTVDDGRASDYQLIATILNPAVATATDLALAHSHRREIESVFDELKTHQREHERCSAPSRPTWCCRRSGASLLPRRDPPH